MALLASLMNAGCSVFGIRNEQQPPYTVARSVDGLEIRDYGPRVVAETVVQGDEVAARSKGFERLAGYIFGGNGEKQSIDMTAPVAQSPSVSPDAIGQARDADGWRIRFFMPAKFTLAALPKPNDPAVTLAEVPPERVAVLRYSGIPSADAVHEAEAKLMRRAAQSQLPVEGGPFSWFYDPPWTIPPLRRNEAVVKLAPAGS